MRRILLPILLLLPACTTAPPIDSGKMFSEWEGFMNQDHILVPGDALTISAFQLPELTQQVVVSPEGTVTLMRIPQPVRAVGRRVSEFRKACEEAYSQIMPSAEISVNLTQPNVKSVYVAGEVRTAGPVPWHAHLSVARAVSAAGGYLITAKDSDIFVVRPDPQTRQPRSIRVNLDKILHGEEVDFPLLPNDIVWVQTSTVADIGNLVELYIRRMLPFQIAGPAIDFNGSNN